MKPTLGQVVRALSIASAACLVVGSLPVAAADAPVVKSLSIYSTLCLHQESGDLLGERITLARYPEGDFVWFQNFEGWVDAGVVVPATIDATGAYIEFSVPSVGGDKVPFSGQLSARALAGDFGTGFRNEKGGSHFRWPRVPENQLKIPICQ